ncbi:MAG: hypothetical protein SGI72_10105 [Planctomycetota bacterium]|nr:hypothetical protein [Planctomycetota bacterium]
MKTIMLMCALVVGLSTRVGASTECGLASLRGGGLQDITGAPKGSAADADAEDAVHQQAKTSGAAQGWNCATNCTIQGACQQFEEYTHGSGQVTYHYYDPETGLYQTRYWMPNFQFRIVCSPCS